MIKFDQNTKHWTARLEHGMIRHIQVKNMGADVMRKVSINFFVLLLCAACSRQMEYIGNFSDGLPTPDKTENFDLPDEYGTKQMDTFYIDVNNNGVKDTIKRGRFVTGTAHSYTFYDIYLDNGKKLARLTTFEGADCILRAYKFQIQPFLITSASRNVGDDYTEPTKAKIEKFEIRDDKMESVSSREYKPICDVRYLL